MDNIIKTVNMQIKPLPFVKWAGGKRQLLGEIQKIISNIKFNRYFEPFVGGGAVAFGIYEMCNDIYINDINKQLMLAYKLLRDKPLEVIKQIDEYDSKIQDTALSNEQAKEYYYMLRKEFNNNILNKGESVKIVALMIWLNKHCFNGLYRCNKNGEFNVPYAGTRGKSYDRENILAVSKMLQNVNIECEDFEKICALADKDDLIFLDSPYVPINNGGFVDYSKEGFCYDDHIRLSKWFDIMNDKGVKCILTNHETELIHKLYVNKGYNYKVVNVRRAINSNANNRKGQEIIIWNF